MKLLVCLASLVPILANTIPYGRHVTEKFDDKIYTTNNTCYVADNNIVKVHSPANIEKVSLIYFVQADTTNKINKGLYALDFNNINNFDFHNVTVTKLLDNGRCITSYENNVYFGATDGIYILKNRTVEKFGSVTANIRDIQKVNGKEMIYIVTEDNKLYTVTDSGNKMEEHDSIKNVQEIVLDHINNIYFYERREDAKTYSEVPIHQQHLNIMKVLAKERILQISGLPDKYTHMQLGNFMGHSVALIDDEFHFLYPNGTSSKLGMGFIDSPTAFSIDWGLLQLYAKDDTLFCYTGLAAELAEAVAEAMRQLVVESGNYIREHTDI